MKKLWLVFASLCGLASPALAQDNAPAPQGFRIEAIGTLDVGSGANRYNDLHAGGVVGYDIRSGKASFGVETEIAREGYVGVRAGVAVGPVLLYAKGGYARGSAIVYTTTALPGGGVSGFSSKRHVDGFRLGAGIEVPVGSRFFVKGEYRYSKYQLGVETHQLAAGVGVRF